MAYDNLREFYDPNIVLPIGRKSYRIVSPNADEGLRLRQILTDDNAILSDAAELAEVLTLLGATQDPETKQWTGGVYEEMKADGITWKEIFHAGRTALLHYGVSSTLAEAHWHTGVGDTGNPMPPEPESTPAPGAKAAAPAKASATATSRAPRARTARKTPAAGRTKKSSASDPGTTT